MEEMEVKNTYKMANLSILPKLRLNKIIKIIINRNFFNGVYSYKEL